MLAQRVAVAVVAIPIIFLLILVGGDWYVAFVAAALAIATLEFERLRTEVFPDLRLALVHGKLKDKDAVMRGFTAGESDILVATPVVEVGVDIPNATVMLIEGADRFGLAQLHQLRGRVGRGGHESYCILLADPVTEDAEARLAAMVRTTDGFELAEVDLELRGEGSLLAGRQSGVPDLRHARLTRHRRLAERARRAALAHLDADPDLVTPASQLMIEEARRLFGTDIDWLTRA